MVAVVAEPEEKASAKRACSRDAMAFSKLSLDFVRNEAFQELIVRTYLDWSF